MPLTRLVISDFRNLASAELEPTPNGFNLIFGNNGSGKTSLLEAIYYISLGRSFRSASSDHVIRKTTDKLSIFAQIVLKSQQVISLGLEKGLKSEFKARMEGKDITSIAEFTRIAPVQLINSQCYNLIEGGPVFRRKYLDWGTFYQCHDFLRVWKQFKRVLKQRNVILGRPVLKKELNAWNLELVTVAEELHQMRYNYVQKLIPELKNKVQELLTYSALEIEYQKGWGSNKEYMEVLNENFERDCQLGYTQYGPHRADLKVTFNSLSAKEILSRGQQKLFVCAMILTQGELLHNSMKTKPIYLVDDLPAELDKTSRMNLITLLSKQEAQVFVTAVERGIFDKCSINKPVKLFHVEHGDLTPLDF